MVSRWKPTRWSSYHPVRCSGTFSRGTSIPLIFMRGVKAEDLVAMIDFLYFGEANVYQEKLDLFLVMAEELKLKELDGNQTEEVVPDEEMKKYFQS